VGVIDGTRLSVGVGVIVGVWVGRGVSVIVGDSVGVGTSVPVTVGRVVGIGGVAGAKMGLITVGYAAIASTRPRIKIEIIIRLVNSDWTRRVSGGI